jgi:hypothetical protein
VRVSRVQAALEGVTAVEIIGPKIGGMRRAAAADPSEFWAEAGR